MSLDTIAALQKTISVELFLKLAQARHSKWNFTLPLFGAV